MSATPTSPGVPTTIVNLPAAGNITGSELIPIVQNGVTCHVPASALTAASSGVSSIIAGTGIAVSGPTGNVTVSATGVAGVNSIIAGSGISVSSSTGNVTVSINAPISVSNGGTGAATLPQNDILIGNGVNPVSGIAPGSAGSVIQTDGTSFFSQPFLANAARNSAQFNVASNTVLADITGLSLTLPGTNIYFFRAVLFTAAAAGGGMQVAIGGTATLSSLRVSAWNYNGTTLNALTTATAKNTAMGAATAVTTNIIIEGTFGVSVIGTLTIQMAQNASSATNSSILSNSNLSAFILS